MMVWILCFVHHEVFQKTTNILEIQSVFVIWWGTYWIQISRKSWGQKQVHFMKCCFVFGTLHSVQNTETTYSTCLVVTRLHAGFWHQYAFSVHLKNILHWLKLWMYNEKSKCFERGPLLPALLSSAWRHHAITTVAKYSVREFS
jgi:hypothetical protein